MKDYKNTLNLPSTEFPMKANLAEREPEFLAYWERIRLYQRLREMGKGRPKFILHDGPPYANSAIHLGTALNKILKDIVIKSKTLSGFDAPFVPGWDCHGLPIELFVEKKVGKAGADLSFSEFRKACRTYASTQVEIQKKDFKRLGVIGDWDNPYLTMNFSYEADNLRALARIIANGHFTRGEKPVHWCASCSSALAEAEVEYKDKSSPSIYVSFDAIAPDQLRAIFNLKTSINAITVPIWTTTPWTLPANRAVAVNPDIDYALVETQGEGQPILLLAAEQLVSTVMHELSMTQYGVHGVVKGRALEGLLLQHPFLDRVVPIILGDHVTLDVGTGFVHTAPAHGEDDFYVGQRYQLVVDNPLNEKSCFNADIPIVAGLHVSKANEPIIVALADRGKLLHQTIIQHSFPHCWRHKTPLIFRATSQWFISMEKNRLRALAIEAADKVQWIPGWGKLRITNMLQGRPDWCVSRQRSWGNPIAIFVHKKTRELHPRTPELMEQVAKLIEQSGIDAWYDCDAAELLGDVQDYEKVTDILDVWFDSGVSHACVLEKRPELHLPADLYLEGSDQHRGWFQTSLLSSLAIHHQSPFKTVLTHGYVVDGKGYKMSKSVGNVVAPSEVITKLGADVLRLWAASQDHSGDVGYSDEIIKRSSDAYRRIRNTARFLLSNLNDFDYEKDKVSDSELLILDQWAVSTTQGLQEKIIDAYERYQFQLIYQLIHNFCTVEMGSFYLDIIKDRQYTGKTSGLPRRSAQTAMWHILEALVRWLAPILSFTAEEIWRFMPGTRSESVFLTTWYTAFPDPSGKSEQDEFWSWMMRVRAVVNKELEDRRKTGEIGSALEAEVFLYADECYAKLADLGDELRFVLIVSKASVFPLEERGKEAFARPTEIPGLWVSVVKSSQKKCARCWQHVEDVGLDKAHAELCLRCVSNAFGEGEIRKIA